MFPKKLLPFCVLHFLFCLSPICCALFMVTFLRRFFLLTLSYLAIKDCPFGNVTCYSVTCRHCVNCFLFILKWCCLLAICYKFCDLTWVLVATTHTNISSRNMLIFLGLAFSWLLFKARCQGLFLNHFSLIFLLLPCILSSLIGQDRPFHRNHTHIHQLILDRQDYLYNLLMVQYCNHCRSRRQIVCITNVFGSNFLCHVFFIYFIFFICQAVYFYKVCQLYRFDVFCC